MLEELPDEDEEVLVETLLLEDVDEVIDELDDVDAGWLLLLTEELLLVSPPEELEDGC